MAEASLERWRVALESRGMRISRTKTEYLCMNREKGEGERASIGMKETVASSQISQLSLRY